MAKRTSDERRILEMFKYMRPMGTPTEQIFIDRFLTPLGFKRDAFKNLVVTVGEAPRILFSSHVDTVHWDEGIQTLHYDEKGILQLSASSKQKRVGCLGADDTAGIWLMTEMVKAKVPGVYIIHYGEENGCIGSKALAKGNPAFFKDIDAAIAFDRYGYTSVITHQMGARTASDAFAQSFAALIDEVSGVESGYAPDDGGAYTDTNEYSHLVPECTNISVGYYSQHTTSETQNVHFLIALRNCLVNMDFSRLVIARDPSVYERLPSRWGNYGSFGYGRGGWADSDLREPWDEPDYYTTKETRSEASLQDLVVSYPEIATQILQAYGLSRNTFLDEVADVYGDAYREAS